MSARKLRERVNLIPFDQFFAMGMADFKRMKPYTDKSGRPEQESRDRSVVKSTWPRDPGAHRSDPFLLYAKNTKIAKMGAESASMLK